VDGVFEADDLLSDEIKQGFLNGIKQLEDSIPIDQRDYPPGYNNQQWELVHPALYTFVSKVTPVTLENIPLEEALNFMGKGEPVTLGDGNTKPDYSLSTSYQFIPSEFKVEDSGKTTI